MKRWSKKYTECKNCSQTEKKHKANGLCSICYDKTRDRTDEKSRISQKKSRQNNKDKINKIARDYNKKKKSYLLGLLGNKCIKCGFDDSRALQIDHINGGGYIERKSYNLSPRKYYSNILQSVLNNENKYQLLCANCNWIKRFEENEK